MYDSIIAFVVGCLVGAVGGIMFFACLIVAREADERSEKIRKGEDNE